MVKKILVFSDKDFLDCERPPPPLMKKMVKNSVFGQNGQKNRSIFWLGFFGLAEIPPPFDRK